MNKLTKKECVIIAVVCFFLAVFSVGFSTIRISDLRAQNMSNINWGVNFISRANNDMVFESDKMEAALVLSEMKTINKKVSFYQWFRIIGGIVFTAGGVFFLAYGMKRKEVVVAKTPTETPTQE